VILAFSEFLRDPRGVFCFSVLVAACIMRLAEPFLRRSRDGGQSFTLVDYAAACLLDGLLTAAVSLVIPPEAAKLMLELLCAALIPPALVVGRIWADRIMNWSAGSSERPTQYSVGRDHVGNTDAVDRAIETPSQPAETPRHSLQGNLNLDNERNVSDEHEE